MRRNIDVVLYDIGDEVIAKNQDKDFGTPRHGRQTVVNTTQVEMSEDRFYQVLYFKSNPESPFVAYEFEPYAIDQKNAYYALLAAMNKERPKPKSKKDEVEKIEEEPFKVTMRTDPLNLFKDLQ
jgi:hypothetical protein